jgi:hypothetical protein
MLPPHVMKQMGGPGAIQNLLKSMGGGDLASMAKKMMGGE